MLFLPNKKSSFSILFLLLLLTFQPLSSSQQLKKNVEFNTSKKDHSQKISSSLLFDITLHGFLLWASMGFLMPVGILVIRMSNREQCGRRLKGSRTRSLWFFIHWMLGTAVSLLGVFNVYSGLFAYHEKTSRRIRIWTIIFTVEISLISFFYLFQDKLEYIQKQGVILGSDLVTPTDQGLSPNDKQKELPTDPC
ncbi:Cytochrome b561 domain-containing protein, partial [Cucurbita argyrosperma subsp. argyrosperma]